MSHYLTSDLTGVARSLTAATDYSRQRDKPDLTLMHLRQTRERLDAATMRAVVEAYHGGMTWAEVGTWLGVTKQAAQQRYRPAYFHWCKVTATEPR